VIQGELPIRCKMKKMSLRMVLGQSIERMKCGVVAEGGLGVPKRYCPGPGVESILKL